MQIRYCLGLGKFDPLIEDQIVGCKVFMEVLKYCKRIWLGLARFGYGELDYKRIEISLYLCVYYV